MKVFSSVALWLLAALVLGGCASNKVTDHRPFRGKIERPDRILVYDFAATAAELRPEVAVAGQGAASPPATAPQLAVGRRLGEEMAKSLVAELQGMGDCPQFELPPGHRRGWAMVWS